MNRGLRATRNRGKVNIAVICATHRDLKELMSQGKFRKDLYYRLNGLFVGLPPLRERSDLFELVERICKQECGSDSKAQISDKVKEIFRIHPWPGNVRQLQAVLRTAIAMMGGGAEIDTQHLGKDFLSEIPSESARDLEKSFSSDRTSLEQVEIEAIRRALRVARGNVSLAATRLGISRTTIYRKMRTAGSETDS